MNAGSPLRITAIWSQPSGDPRSSSPAFPYSLLLWGAWEREAGWLQTLPKRPKKLPLSVFQFDRPVSHFMNVAGVAGPKGSGILWGRRQKRQPLYLIKHEPESTWLSSCLLNDMKRILRNKVPKASMQVMFKT